jgi:transcriptional regulator with XRE-family HTH domain
MSRPRLLTDPEEIAASNEFKRCLLASKKTQEQVAAEIGSGVSQGTVWQWANGRLAIPAQRARDAARAVGADPEKISTQFRLIASMEPVILEPDAPRIPHSRVSEPGATYARLAQDDQSHRVGIALSTVADAMMVIRAYLEDKGEPVENLPDPVLVKAALDLVVERAEPLTLTNVIAFKRQLATRLKETDNGDERREAAGAG